MLIAIIFVIIGVVVTSFTLISILICFVFGIPTTKKLERASMLVNNHPIIKRYLISIGLLLSIFLIILALICLFGSPGALGGYIGGSILALFFGIGKIKKNKDNIADYINTQSRYFSQPVENVINFLNK